MFSVVCKELQFDRQLNVIRCHCRARTHAYAVYVVGRLDRQAQ